MKAKGNDYEMRTRPVPREITKAVVDLAKLCAKHDFPLELDDALLARVHEQDEIITNQRKVLAELEKQLGIDDEL